LKSLKTFGPTAETVLGGYSRKNPLKFQRNNFRGFEGLFFQGKSIQKISDGFGSGYSKCANNIEYSSSNLAMSPIFG